MGCPEQKILAFLGGWKYKLSKQRINSNTHAEGIFYFIFQKEAIFAGADTLIRRENPIAVSSYNEFQRECRSGTSYHM